MTKIVEPTEQVFRVRDQILNIVLAENDADAVRPAGSSDAGADHRQVPRRQLHNPRPVTVRACAIGSATPQDIAQDRCGGATHAVPGLWEAWRYDSAVGDV